MENNIKLSINKVYKKYPFEAGLFAKYGKWVHAVNGVSIDIKKNETYGLVGESGCGKSSLARLLVKMYETNSGSIIFKDDKDNEYDFSRLDKKSTQNLRTKIKYIFQDPAKSMDPRMKVLDILCTGLKYSGNWQGKADAYEKALSIIRDVGLNKEDLEKRPSDFSGGQRQRISIARALIMNPEMLICDEVVSALDVSVQSQILNLLLKLKDKYKLAIMFISHDLSVVSYVSDRVGVMYSGKIVEESSAENIVKKQLHPYTKLLYSSVPSETSFDQLEASSKIESPKNTEEPEGCPFYHRCEKRQDICKNEAPSLKELKKDHFAACYFPLE